MDAAYTRDRDRLLPGLCNSYYWAVVDLKGNIVDQVGCPPHCLSWGQYDLCETDRDATFCVDDFCIQELRQNGTKRTIIEALQHEDMKDLECMGIRKFLSAVRRIIGARETRNIKLQLLRSSFRVPCLYRRGLLQPWLSQTVDTILSGKTESVGWWPCRNLLLHFTFPIFDESGSVTRVLLIGPIVKTEIQAEDSVVLSNSVRLLRYVMPREFKKYSDFELQERLKKIPHFTDAQNTVIEIQGFVRAMEESERLRRDARKVGIAAAEMVKENEEKITHFYAQEIKTRSTKLLRSIGHDRDLTSGFAGKSSSGNGTIEARSARHPVPQSRLEKNNPWTTGLFYTAVAVVLLVSFAGALSILPWFLAPVFLGGLGGVVLLTVIIGLLQQMGDGTLGESSFRTLLIEALKKLPRLKNGEATRKTRRIGFDEDPSKVD